MHFSMWEKGGFALLIAAWVVWGSIQIGNTLVKAEPLEEHAYKIEVEGSGTETAAVEEVVEESITVLLASASAEAGEKAFRRCAACHTMEKGGPNKVGPNLYGVVGAGKGVHDGYTYSSALLDLGGEWTYENLDAFLKSPRAYAPGNKMTFNGLRKASDRANVILYLRTYNDNPPPLP